MLVQQTVGQHKTNGGSTSRICCCIYRTTAMQNCQLALDTCLGILRLMTSGQLLQPRKHEPLPNIGLMLAHRLQRWPLIKPTLAECVVSTGNYCAPE